jgi:hypothetical protein
MRSSPDGYNAAAAFGQSTSDAIDHAKGLPSSLIDNERRAGCRYKLKPTSDDDRSEEKDRLLKFVAYSLEGIVVKQVNGP